jgi:hypothetical protein
MNKIKQAIVTPTIAAGSTASPYYIMCNITQPLCYAACTETTPVFAPQFSVKSISAVGTSQYVANIAVNGIISYIRAGQNACSCCTQQPLSAEFTIAFASTATPSDVTLTAGATINTLSANACCECSRTFVSETPLTLTVVTTS